MEFEKQILTQLAFESTLYLTLSPNKMLFSLYRLVEGGWGMSAGRVWQGTLILGNFWNCCLFRSGTSDALNVSGRRPTPLISGKLVFKLVKPGRSLCSRNPDCFLFPVAPKVPSGGEGPNKVSPDWERWVIAGKAATLWCRSGNKAKLHSHDYHHYLVLCTK